eukprot:scaffold3051_cov175-Amphora_coffeaeformis.AAC.2
MPNFNTMKLLLHLLLWTYFHYSCHGDTLDDVISEMEKTDFHKEAADFTIEGMDSAIEGVDQMIEAIDFVVEGALHEAMKGDRKDQDHIESLSKPPTPQYEKL